MSTVQSGPGHTPPDTGHRQPTSFHYTQEQPISFTESSGFSDTLQSSMPSLCPQQSMGELFNPPPTQPEVSLAHTSPLESSGTLMIHAEGRTKFIGPSASAQYLGEVSFPSTLSLTRQGITDRITSAITRSARTKSAALCILRLRPACPAK